MAKLSIVVTALLVTCAALPVVVLADEQYVTGTWTGEQRGNAAGGDAGFTADVTMKLLQIGNQVSGLFSRRQTSSGRREAPVENLKISGTLTGNELMLMIGPQWKFTFTVNGNAMQGSSVFSNNPSLALSLTKKMSQ